MSSSKIALRGLTLPLLSLCIATRGLVCPDDSAGITDTLDASSAASEFGVRDTAGTLDAASAEGLRGASSSGSGSAHSVATVRRLGTSGTTGGSAGGSGRGATTSGTFKAASKAADTDADTED